MRYRLASTELNSVALLGAVETSRDLLILLAGDGGLMEERNHQTVPEPQTRQYCLSLYGRLCCPFCICSSFLLRQNKKSVTIFRCCLAAFANIIVLQKHTLRFSRVCVLHRWMPFGMRIRAAGDASVS